MLRLMKACCLKKHASVVNEKFPGKHLCQILPPGYVLDISRMSYVGSIYVQCPGMACMVREILLGQELLFFSEKSIFGTPLNGCFWN